MQATLNGDGIIIEAEHGGGPRVTITFTDGVTINEALCADFAVRLLSGIGPRGPGGPTGNGIASVTLNQDYTLTLTFTDGTTFTTPVSLRGATGETGPTGATFTPSVDSSGNISWTNDGGKTNPQTVNIKGPQGETGTTFTPSVDSSGNISWANDGGKTNPQTVNIKGPQGDNYVLTQQDKEDIADLVEAQINADTGWVDQTINTDSKLDKTNTWVQARKIGKVVNVRGMLATNAQFAAQATVTVCTLGADFRPSAIVREEVGAYDALWTLSIETDGDLVERNSSGSQSGSKSNRFNVTYFVD